MWFKVLAWKPGNDSSIDTIAAYSQLSGNVRTFGRVQSLREMGMWTCSLPKTWLLTRREMYSVTVLEARSLKSGLRFRCQWGYTLSGGSQAPGKVSSWPLSFWWLPTCLGCCLHRSVLCLQGHIASWACVKSPSASLLQGWLWLNLWPTQII